MLLIGIEYSRKSGRLSRGLLGKIVVQVERLRISVIPHGIQSNKPATLKVTNLSINTVLHRTYCIYVY